MKELMKIRMFELRGAQYVMIGSDVTLEQYIMDELRDDFSILDMNSFGPERLRISTQYNPAAAQKVLESGNVLTGEKPVQDV